MIWTIPRRYCYELGHASNPLFNVIYNVISILRLCTMNIQYNFSPYKDSVQYTYLVCYPVQSILSSPPHRPYWCRSAHFMAAIFFLSALSFHIFPFSFCVSLELLILFYFLFVFSLVLSLCIDVFRSVLCNDLGKYPKDRCLTIDIDVLLYKEQDGRPKVVGSGTISGAGVSDVDELNGCLHCGDLYRGSGSDPTVVKAVVIHKGRFLLLFPCEFRCNIRETSRIVSNYGFYVSDS